MLRRFSSIQSFRPGLYKFGTSQGCYIVRITDWPERQYEIVSPHNTVWIASDSSLGETVARTSLNLMPEESDWI